MNAHDPIQTSSLFALLNRPVLKNGMSAVTLDTWTWKAGELAEFAALRHSFAPTRHSLPAWLDQAPLCSIREGISSLKAFFEYRRLIRRKL
jgi:hypothetical protein